MIPDSFTHRGVPGYEGNSSTTSSLGCLATNSDHIVRAYRDTASGSNQRVSRIAASSRTWTAEALARYAGPMPKLWTETIEAHRAAVREATLETTAALIAERGLQSVTMSQIAERTGIGRATLYKYFPDVGAILFAWHERQVSRHLDHLTQLRDRAGSAGERLRAVLEGFALIANEARGHDAELVTLLHRGGHVARAHQQLGALIATLLAEAAADGAIRDDVAPDELACYCLHALTAASSLRSKAAIGRLVTITLAGLRRSA
jgi:AcrR family transcriptional regulator